jgi:FkbM family methyltransferase
MTLFKKTIGLWQKAPPSFRSWLVGSPIAPVVRRWTNRILTNQPEVFELAEPLRGYRMRLHWQTQKAFVFGTFEVEVTRAIQRVVRHGWTVVDIGAHIGYETLLLAQQVGSNGRIFAFEPLADNFRVLTENISLNGCQNITAENKAVINVSGRVSLTRADSDPLTPTSRVVMDGGSDIAAVSIDDYFRNSQFPISFLKIDAEGAEGLILEGMHEILKRDRPILLVEVHSFDIHRHQHPALLLLKESGYTVEFLEAEGAHIHILAQPAG